MLDHHLVRRMGLHRVRQLVAERGAQPVAVALDAHETPVEPRLDADLVGPPPPDDLLGVGHLHCEVTVEPEEPDLAPGETHLLRRRQRGVASGSVVDDGPLDRSRRAGKHVPRARAVLGAVDPVEVRDAAGRDDDDVGVAFADRVGLDVRVEAHVDPEPFQLPAPPVDDAGEVASPARAVGEEHLPAERA